jgi:hypothetical protein
MPTEVDWFSVSTLLLIPLACGAAAVVVAARLIRKPAKKIPEGKPQVKSQAAGR